jgi:hypothetical protein
MSESILRGAKYPTVMGQYKVRDKKSSISVFNEDYSTLVAREFEKKLQRKDKLDYGEKYKKGKARPAEGAFVIVPDENAATMLDVLVLNGLPVFENSKVAVDFTFKDIVIRPGENDYITEIPMLCELLFKHPQHEYGHGEIYFRTLLIDPRFLDERGNQLYKELPKRYIKAVLNTFNPMIAYRAYFNELDELLLRSGDQAEAYGKVIKYAAQQWKNRETPDDIETLQDIVSMGMLHEFTHALSLHLPDLIPECTPSETKRDLEAISFEKYLEFIMSDNDLITSVAFNKNLFKALNEVKGNKPGQSTHSTINANLVLEMFCDRFSMFLYQNSIKIKVYRQLFREAEMPYTIDVNSMQTMEAQRKAGQLFEVRGLKNIFTVEQFRRLEYELEAADRSHYLISKFGDPSLKDKELTFYCKFLDLLIHFDSEKMIMKFTMEHAINSRFMRISVSGLKTPENRD